MKESQIAAVLSDIRQKGFSSVQPFSIGKVEERMIQFAQDNAIVLASNELYMSAKQLQISREMVAQVNFITATRLKDPAEFTLPKYHKI